MKPARIFLVIFSVLVPFGVASPPATAAMAVVDVKAISHLVSQVKTLNDQLNTMRDSLDQARQEFESIRGQRGMENLLAGTVRNYLPADWAQLDATLRGMASSYSALANSLQDLIETNAVLTPEQVALLSPMERAQLDASRRSVALLQATTREALANTSARFASIQQLVNAIPGATDQKAILDLQARIAAEQGMLHNEQIKLDLLERTAQAEERARRQRVREQAIDDIGSFASLPPMDL
jgi:type IV secretion system protein VirB5